MSRLSRSHFIAGSAATLALAPQVIRAQAPVKIRMSAVPTDDMTPIYYAVKNGLYQKAGLDFEIVVVSSGSASTAAVVSGTYEMGKASPIASVIAHLKGFPITIVANGAVYLARTPYSGMLVASDAPFKTAADLNGKIGAAAGLNDINHMAMLNWIEKNGGDPKSVKFVEIPASATAPALIEHRVDFAILNEPLYHGALETGKIRLFADGFASVSDRWLTSAYLAQPEWAKKNADAMRRFERVTFEATAYTNTHKAETAAMMSELTKIPLPVFSKMSRIEGATSNDPSYLTPVIALALKYNAIPRSFPAREMYWTNTPA
jgi:ABC-type nitrate/sulfonate/bicarbonate transport system substrate-binding protein